MRWDVAIFMITFKAVLGQEPNNMHAQAEWLATWLPDKVGDYMYRGTAYADVLRWGTGAKYPVASRNYGYGESGLMIFIADYKGLDVPRRQARVWAAGEPFDDDRRVGGSLEVTGFPAWQSYSKDKNSAILYVAVKERYLLTLTLSGGNTEFLKKVAEGLSLKSLP
jgi:hypothetical protein